MGMDHYISVQSVRHGYATLAKLIAGFQDEAIYGGHITATGAVAKVFFISALPGLWVGTLPFLIAYISALIVYSFDYYRSAENDMITNPGRAAYFLGMSSSFPYRMLAYAAILAASLALYASVTLTIVVFMMAALGIAYSVFLKKITRYLPGFKNVYTSGVWTAGTISGVLACCPVPLETTVILIFLFMFLRSLGNVIYFDLKDILPDGSEGLKTVPACLGREKTFALLGALNVVSFLPLAAGVMMGVLPAYVLAMTAIGIFTFYYLRQARARPDNYLNYPLADAETLLWPAVLLIAGGISAL